MPSQGKVATYMQSQHGASTAQHRQRYTDTMSKTEFHVCESIQRPSIHDLSNRYFPFLARPKRLFVVLGQYLLTHLNVLVLGLLLRGASVDDLLPLVVFRLALSGCQLPSL
jgi:hypothetical protein